MRSRLPSLPRFGEWPLPGRTLVLIGIVLAALNLRTAVTSITPLLDQLGQHFGFGDTMAGVLGMLPSAAFAVFGVSTPLLAHRLGLERTALLSMLLATLGLVMRSCAGDISGLLYGSIVALAGAGIGNVVLPPLVKRYFADRVGGLSALYLTVLQLGTTLPPLLAVPMATAAGWRFSMGVWALLALAAALPWVGVVWAERRRDSALARVHAAAVRGDDQAPELSTAPPRGRVWRTSLGWGATLMFGLTSLVTYSMFTWLPRILVEAGASRSFGGTMVALYSALGLVSALTIPALAARMRNPFALVLACAACHLAGFAGLLLAPLTWPLVWISLVGLGPSTFPLGLTLINLRTRTAAGSAALSGFMQGVGYALACLGPLLFGILHAASGDWTWPFAMLALSVLITVLGGWVACKPRMLEDLW